MKKQLDYTEERNLDCELTDAEVKEAGEDLAHRFMDVQSLITDRARINAKIKPIEQEIEKLVVKIDSKRENRPVSCDWHFDWVKGKKTLYRTDTGEQVDQYDITDIEKQLHLELNGEE